MYVIYAYPHFPDLVAAMNALADAEGQPSFQEIAAQADSDAEAATEVDVPGDAGANWTGISGQDLHLFCATGCGL